MALVCRMHIDCILRTYPDAVPAPDAFVMQKHWSPLKPSDRKEAVSDEFNRDIPEVICGDPDKVFSYQRPQIRSVIDYLIL